MENMNEIVIRQADKVGAVTILDKGLYMGENKKNSFQMTRHTKKCHVTPLHCIKNIAHVNEGVLKGVITKKQADYIIP